MPNRIVYFALRVLAANFKKSDFIFFMGNIEVTIIRNFNHGLNRRSRELTIKVFWSLRFDQCESHEFGHFWNRNLFSPDSCVWTGPLNLSGELVRTQFLGSVTGHFEPFTVWSSQLTGMESLVPSSVLTKVFCVMLYSVMHFCVLRSAWCLFDGGPFRASSLYHGS